MKCELSHTEVRKMKKIEILGMGCAKCNQLAERAENAVKDLGIEAEVTR